jgi:type II secretory pathway component PulL
MISLKQSSPVYLEITPEVLRALQDEDGLELSLERTGTGALTAACRERVVASLKIFLKNRSWSQATAICAISARGLSLRRLSLPPCPRDELPRLIRLQIEREFPLGPEDLAWGYQSLKQASTNGNGSQQQEVIVAAVRKELIQEYADILKACGLDPIFTPGALARQTLCRGTPQAYALLDLGTSQSELITFEKGLPASLRVLPWGNEQLQRAISGAVELDPGKGEVSDSELRQKITAIATAELNALMESIQRESLGEKVFISGRAGLSPRAITSRGIGYEPLKVSPGEGRSAAVLGIKEAFEQSGEVPIVLQHQASARGQKDSRPLFWKWGALACALALVAILLPYTVALVQKPRLARRIAEIEAYRDKLPRIERDLSFLQYLQTNQPPYLDAIYAMANAAQPGVRIESLSMSRRGDVSLRASMRDSQQLTQFRSRLIDSGWFSSVVVEEQSPTPDRQKINVRIIGQWKPLSEVKPLDTAIKAKPSSKTATEPPAAPALEMREGGPQ